MTNVIRCDPPGSIATAIDIDVDSGERWCGMCEEKTAIRLGDICPGCGHRLDWFQINDTVTAIGGWSDFARYLRRKGITLGLAATEENLAKALAELRAHDEFDDGAWGDDY